MPHTGTTFKKGNETEITAFFLSNEIGIDINEISVSVVREMSPIYTMPHQPVVQRSTRIQGTMRISLEELAWEDIQPVFSRIEIKKYGEIIYLLIDNYIVEQSVIGNQYQILFTSQKSQIVTKERGQCILISIDDMINGMLQE